MSAYTLEKHNSREWRLAIPEKDLAGNESRGAVLARSMSATRANGAYFLTPVRARKWKALYDAGWSAEPSRAKRWKWQYVPPGRKTVFPLRWALLVVSLANAPKTEVIEIGEDA